MHAMHPAAGMPMPYELAFCQHILTPNSCNHGHTYTDSLMQASPDITQESIFGTVRAHILLHKISNSSHNYAYYNYLH